MDDAREREIQNVRLSSPNQKRRTEMNAFTKFATVRGTMMLAGLLTTFASADAFGAGYPVIVSRPLVMTAAAPYYGYPTYGAAGTYVPAASYPSTYSSYYGAACPGGNCAVMPNYTTGYGYSGSATYCPGGVCPTNGGTYSNCVNGQCFPTTPGTATYPANYYTVPSGYSMPSGGSYGNPVYYYTVPAGSSAPVSYPAGASPGTRLPAGGFPVVGTTPGSAAGSVIPTGGAGGMVDSPFYP